MAFYIWPYQPFVEFARWFRRKIASQQTFLSAVIFMVSSFALVVQPTFSQPINRVVVWSKSPTGSLNERVAPQLQLFREVDGVEIQDILVEGKSITVGELFAADDDWLKTLTFRIKNISEQRLERIQISLVLPDMGQNSPDIPFCYGCSTAGLTRAINSRDVVDLKMIDGGFYAWLRERMSQHNVSTVSKAEIHHIYVTVSTGPKWFSGCVKTANPRNACPRRAP